VLVDLGDIGARRAFGALIRRAAAKLGAGEPRPDVAAWLDGRLVALHAPWDVRAAVAETIEGGRTEAEQGVLVSVARARVGEWLR
jgi:hypothetical protein